MIDGWRTGCGWPPAALAADVPASRWRHSRPGTVVRCATGCWLDHRPSAHHQPVRLLYRLRRRDPTARPLSPARRRRASKRRSTVSTGSSRMAVPCSVTTASRSPRRSSARRALSSSSCAERPFIATRVPPGSSRGTHHCASVSSRGDRPGRHPRSPKHAGEVLRSSAVHGHRLQAQLTDGVREPVGPPQHRLDEVDVEVGTRDGERDTRQAGARPDVHHPGAVREGVGDDGAVQQVTLPQSGHLPGPDQAVRHPGVGQHCGEPGGLGHPVAEHTSRTRRCGWWWRGRLVHAVVFHVKRLTPEG